MPHPVVHEGLAGRLCYIENLAGIGCNGLVYMLPTSLLGFELVDGHIWRPTRKRFWKVSRAIQCFLEPHRLWCGRHVESLVDHAPYMVLVRRELLAYFSSVYVFIRESQNKRQHLWTSVIEDLGTARHGHLGHWTQLEHISRGI